MADNTEEKTNEQNEKYSDAKIKSPLIEKLENFFYYYKWHALIVIFIIFTVTVCTLQMCSKTEYDFYIMYAGDVNISTSAKEGEAEAEYGKLISATKRFVDDYDGDGSRNVSFMNLYLPSNEQMMELENSEYFATMIAENRETLEQYAYYGEYYVCIMSERLFLEYTKDYDKNPFRSIEEYLPSGALIAENEDSDGYRLANEWGVYLSSTPLADNPGFSSFGEDSVLCIRKYFPFGTRGSKEDSQKYYAFAEQTFRLMLKDEAY